MLALPTHRRVTALAALLAVAATSALAQAPAAAPAAPTQTTKTFGIDPVHSNIGFSIRHLVSRTRGRFGDVKGLVTTDSANLAATKATVSVAMTSIDTANPKRDGHLRSPDFFDVDKHPEMTFELKEVVPVGADRAIAKGDLTIKGVTKPVELQVTDIAFGTGFGGKALLGFTATTTINRTDFGITWNKALDAGHFVLGDEVAIELNVEAWEADPAPAAVAGQ